MEYKLRGTWINRHGEEESRDWRGTCRESLLYAMSSNMTYQTPDDSDDVSYNLGATNIRVFFQHASNKFCEEIAQRFGLVLEASKASNSIFEAQGFTVSGNDTMIAPACYWIVTALRYNKQFGDYDSFLDFISSNADGILGSVFYYSQGARNGARGAWKLVLENGVIPTTKDLLITYSCLLEWYREHRNISFQ